MLKTIYVTMDTYLKNSLGIKGRKRKIAKRKAIYKFCEKLTHPSLEYSAETYTYKRKEKGWEAFESICKSPKQLSPTMKIENFVVHIAVERSRLYLINR